MQLPLRCDVTKVTLSLCSTVTAWSYAPKYFQLRTRWKCLASFMQRQLNTHKQLNISLYMPQNRSEDCTADKHFLPHGEFKWAGQISQYSDSSRAGRSGDRIPVKARFYAPVQTGPGARPASRKIVPGLFSPSKAAGAWCCPPTVSSADV
jgi:hypothetical protein